MSKRTPPAPPSLGSRARSLWKALHEDWRFTPDELEILKLACEAADRAHRAQKILDVEGITTKDRFGQVKEHPAVAVRNAAETSAAKLLKQLGLAREAERALKNERIRKGVVQAWRSA